MSRTQLLTPGAVHCTHLQVRKWLFHFSVHPLVRKFCIVAQPAFLSLHACQLNTVVILSCTGDLEGLQALL